MASHDTASPSRGGSRRPGKTCSARSPQAAHRHRAGGGRRGWTEPAPPSSSRDCGRVMGAAGRDCSAHDESRSSYPGRCGAAAVHMRPAIRQRASGSCHLRALGRTCCSALHGILSIGQATFFGSAPMSAGYLPQALRPRVPLAMGVGVRHRRASRRCSWAYLWRQRRACTHHADLALNQLFTSSRINGPASPRRDGMPGIRARQCSARLRDTLHYYVLGPSSSCCRWVFFVMKRIVESPLGKDPEESRGTRCARKRPATTAAASKLLAFVIGGAFSGAGRRDIRHAVGHRAAGGDRLRLSGNVVFATLIGGSGSLYGPIIGSFVFLWRRSRCASCGRAGRCSRRGFVIVCVLRGRSRRSRSRIGDSPDREPDQTRSAHRRERRQLRIAAGTLTTRSFGRTARQNHRSSTCERPRFEPSSGRILLDGREITGTPAGIA